MPRVLRRPRFTGLWRNPDFVKLWTGNTVSQLGTLMGALQFTAVLALDATPFQMGVLSAASVAPGLALGLMAGVWVDRVARRPILIIADLGRAALLGSIPAAYFLDLLRIEQLYLVAFGSGILTIFFDVAYRSYLPSLVSRRELVEANSKLTATESVVEVTSFSLGGWIAQLASAITVAAIDAFTFLFSGIALALIRKRELDTPRRAERRSAHLEIRDGLALVWRNTYLRAIGGVTLIEGFAGGIIGALILLYGINVLGFKAGVLGTLFAVGGVSSIFGAVLAGRVTRRFGIGPSMTWGLLIAHLSTFFIPLAQGPLFMAGTLLAIQQLGDGPATVYDINQVSLRQSVAPDRMLGRVNASLRVVEMAAIFIGSLAAGVLGELIGLRLSLTVAAGIGMLAWLWLALSPVRSLRDTP
ncbi:MAG: MFS transporter [Chloroflexi bacterium]|nr:MFS transporter [Chloroflexota bacterium]